MLKPPSLPRTTSTFKDGWAGFIRRAKPDRRQGATHYYLNAYFLDPHFYDTSHAETTSASSITISARRSSLGSSRTGSRSKRLLGPRIRSPPASPSPRWAKSGKRSTVKPLIEAMGHDDPNIRWQATEALKKNVDRSFDKDLKALLDGPDLRKRRLAGYIAIKLWGKDGIAAVQPWLKSPMRRLLRSMPSRHWWRRGRSGRKIIHEYRPGEKHPWLVKLLEQLDGK